MPYGRAQSRGHNLAKKKKTEESPAAKDKGRKEKVAADVPAAAIVRADASSFAVTAARIADQRHCNDIVILDLRGLSPATDYFVIATGTSDRQMRTVADEISQEAKKQNQQRFGRAGYEQGRWIVLDFIDVVIHIFDNEYRDYYDLELLWGDAKRVDY
jgi:ribosome-associated protein